MASSSYPLVSIITCVYNGEKYISKLFDSVLGMGYPNIEHIVINDGSTDNTEEIVKKYALKYNTSKEKRLFIKYIKQSNQGLGSATNTGLKYITGEYWTWINCDDWYEPGAFFEPIDFLENNNKISFVQMNGFFVIDGIDRFPIITQKNRTAFNNKKKLICQYGNYYKHFKWLLYICKTEHYRKINPTMSIYPSRFTQDDQLISQMFGVLKGSYINTCKWNFYVRNDSYLRKISNDLYREQTKLCIESIKLLDISNNKKRSLICIVSQREVMEQLKYHALNHKPILLIKDWAFIIKQRIRTFPTFWIYYDHKIPLYFLYSLLFFLKKRKR